MTRWGPEHCNQCRYSESLCGDCYRQMIAESTDRRCESGAVDALGECFACDAIQGEACRIPKLTESTKSPTERKTPMSKRGWIGVDLDGTLAHHDIWVSPDHIGEPLAPMVARIKGWIGEGIEVRIMTARAWQAPQEVIDTIQDWTEKHIGHRLPVTCTKDYEMIQLWDDRAVQVIPNTGHPVQYLPG